MTRGKYKFRKFKPETLQLHLKNNSDTGVLPKSLRIPTFTAHPETTASGRVTLESGDCLFKPQRVFSWDKRPNLVMKIPVICTLKTQN